MNQPSLINQTKMTSREIPELQSGEVVADEVMSLEELGDFLNEAGVSTEEWGQGDSKTVKHLLDEVNSGEAVLEMIDGTLTRKTRVVRSHIYYIIDDDVWRLQEVRQVFKSDGRVRTRKLGQAVGEKMRDDETPEEAMKRGIYEELGVGGDLYFVREDEHFRRSPSLSYPGVVTDQTTYDFRTTLSDDQFNPAGYTEDGETMTTHFRWHNITQVEH